MSHQNNTELYELAAQHIDYWAGEGIGPAIEADLERDDLEGLHAHLKESAKIMFDLEYNPHNEMEQTDAY